MSILTSEQQAIKQAAKNFVAQHIIPRAAEFDRSGEFTPFLLEAAKASKIFSMAIPKEYGGLDYPNLANDALGFLFRVDGKTPKPMLKGLLGAVKRNVSFGRLAADGWKIYRHL